MNFYRVSSISNFHIITRLKKTGVKKNICLCGDDDDVAEYVTDDTAKAHIPVFYILIQLNLLFLNARPGNIIICKVFLTSGRNDDEDGLLCGENHAIKQNHRENES